jgi:SNF2 family DNA or RNA helicase
VSLGCHHCPTEDSEADVLKGLRRTKDIIKDQLTKKYDEVVFCPLTDVQMKVYKRILGMEAVQNMIKKDEQCGCGKGKKYCNSWLASVRY